ncbi:hypothetical protein HU200_028687 [Digitaria exilis]|uniref:Disease resistance protein At4g27190-like leucine-rich repeats domain-containing protein n=1 Tax=Digitaria exilis TaxID=1010633 RepID=A0A835C5Z8_9POAL|nr:hypothetical protein HU200_028687 [Digitaria exilis]
MFTPKLETVYIRGCWGLRRLPATDIRRRQDGCPVLVDCEKDWWDKLEWDGMESGHHPSLFEPRHSKYYRKRHLRGTVLRPSGVMGESEQDDELRSPVAFVLCEVRFIDISAVDIPTAVREIAPLLGSSRTSIYFDGWDGLGASAVLRAIAEHPPPSLREKFDKIIQIDCSRWKSQRELQRAIADELKLTKQVAAIFDVQDEEDDFNGVNQAYRREIKGVTTVIARSLAQYRCLVIFHNGGDELVYLPRCGIPQPDFFETQILWTFRGRLRVNKEILKKFIILTEFFVSGNIAKLNALLAEEARDIALYTHKLGLGVTPEVATDCCLYLLALNDQGGGVIDYTWATHASNYWVCDGIVKGGHDNQAWKIARTLQQQIRIDDYSSKDNRVPHFGSKLDVSKKHWVSLINSYFEEVPSGTTSLFFAPLLESAYVSFPRERFHEAADQLRVLKLCRCTFSFSSPPFHCCRNLRFLGLDKCVDEKQLGEKEEKTGAKAVETFKRLWVLDVSHTDWELDFPLETDEPTVATDIREVHVNRGRVWHINFAWRRLPNLNRLRVVEPTSPWETGREDEFMDMIKLELLDLSGNSTIKVLPSLSGAANLKTLVLEGCVGLEHVGPQGLPPSLESFSFDSGFGKDDAGKAKISRIILTGCAKLADFRMCGSLPNLVELDLSHTAVKMLDLKDESTVQALQKVFLVGCKQLRSISWPYGKWDPLKLLCIDTRAGGEVARKPSWCDSLMGCHGKGDGTEYLHAFVAVTDMRFLGSVFFLQKWEWNIPEVKRKMIICCSSSSKDNGNAGRIVACLPLAWSLTYNDVSTEQQKAIQIDGNSCWTPPFQPLDIHMEIGEGVSDVPNTDRPGSIFYAMDKVKSLHVHDSSSITNVTPEHIFLSAQNNLGVMNELKWCRVERCPRLQTVFTTLYDGINFRRLETFWAAHLLMARSIWHFTPGETRLDLDHRSFEALQAIHLHFCPRLRHVRTLSWNDDLSNHLETLHILCCGDLRQVFPVEQEILEKIAASRQMQGMVAFPKLKYLYLYHLSSLELICDAKMFAPKLERVYIRGCWGLKRLPATDSHRRQEGHPVAVDCEKDWWDRLEWDGMDSGHHPSLFEPRHSKYYRKRHLQGTVLR